MLCCSIEMKDWSYPAETHQNNEAVLVPHFYCSKCGKTIHAGEHYSFDEWFFHINELHSEELDMLERSPHVHELINHRGC